MVAVSQGCLNYLTRDELQGVVAHEFSHVDPEVISYAQALHDGMPDLRVAAQEPFSARALVYALLLDPRADLRDLQLAR